MSGLKFECCFVAGFNLIPASPVDGGRLLRAGIWKCTGKMTPLFFILAVKHHVFNVRAGSKLRATKIAARMGIFFGFFFIFSGLFSLIFGASLNGLWYFFLGSLLASAAWAEEQNAIMMDQMKRVSVRQVVHMDIVPTKIRTITRTQTPTNAHTRCPLLWSRSLPIHPCLCF